MRYSINGQRSSIFNSKWLPETGLYIPTQWHYNTTITAIEHRDPLKCASLFPSCVKSNVRGTIWDHSGPKYARDLHGLLDNTEYYSWLLFF